MVSSLTNRGLAVHTHEAFCDKGDSLMPSVLRQDKKQIHLGLSKWLKAIFGGPFKDMGRTFAIGKQKDSHSCGICVINSIEHELFGTTLITHSSRNALRIHYFTEAMKFVLKEVKTRSIRANDQILTSVCPDYSSTWPNGCRDFHGASPDGSGKWDRGGYGCRVRGGGRVDGDDHKRGVED